MHHQLRGAALALGSLAAVGLATHVPSSEVTSEKLRSAVSIDSLATHLEQLQAFADQTPSGDRFLGSQGDVATVDYIFHKLDELDSYNITLHHHHEEILTSVNTSLIVEGTPIEVEYMGLSSGSFAVDGVSRLLKLPPLPPASLLCDDYTPPLMNNSILFLSWEFMHSLGQTCDTALDRLMEATIESGSVKGFLLHKFFIPFHLRPTTEFPALFLSSAGESELDKLTTLIPDPMVQEFSAHAVAENRTGFGLTAKTLEGDQDNVLFLGAHVDSSLGSPGINDNGSGAAMLLEIALHLPVYNHTNAVQFNWWASNLWRGDNSYLVEQFLEDLDKIRLYLDFDMLGSGNGIIGVLNGNITTLDGKQYEDATETTPPIAPAPGSEQASRLFEDYFASEGLAAFNYSSEFQSNMFMFQALSIPASGLCSGGSRVKTSDWWEVFGGDFSEPCDPNHHLPSDRLENMSRWLLETNLGAAAHAVATYADSWEGFPLPEPATELGNPFEGVLLPRLISQAPKKPRGWRKAHRPGKIHGSGV